MTISRGQAEAVIVAAWGCHAGGCEDKGDVLTSPAARRAIEGAFGCDKVPYQYCAIISSYARWSEILHELADAIGANAEERDRMVGGE